MLRIGAWNVNGYTDSKHQTVLAVLEKYDVFCLSETHLKDEAFFAILKSSPTTFKVIFNSHNPAKWHGVAMFIHPNLQYEVLPIKMNCQSRTDSNDKNDPCRGRIIAININNVNIITCYTPNSGTDQTHAKYKYRTEIWDPAFFDLLKDLKDQKTVIIGDLNCALEPQDVSSPLTMVRYAGFTIPERTNFIKLFLELDYLDAYRMCNPNTKQFSWLGRNTGMRLDHTLVSKKLIDYVVSAGIFNCTGSDHLPVSCVIDQSRRA